MRRFSFVRSLIELRRRLPAQMTDQNRFAWGEAHAIAEEIHLYSYHMDAASSREGRFAPIVGAQHGGLLLATSLKLTASGSIEMIGHVYASNSPEGGQRVWRAEVDASGKLLRDEVGEPLPPHGSPRTKQLQRVMGRRVASTGRQAVAVGEYSDCC